MLDAHVVKRRHNLLVDVRVTVDHGNALGLFGPSGAGKSTALNCIAGIEQPDAGAIRFEERVLFPQPPPLHRRGVGYLTQDANLFAHLRVADNVKFGAHVDPGDPWIAELRAVLRLEPFWDSPARAISGGQARRVSLARMLAPRPRLVLLDEPFTGLDRHLVRELLDALATWQRRLRFTMVVVGHEPDILERISPFVVAIENGTVVQSGTWSELRASPESALLAQLLAPL
ncbi:MAG: ATP-binding cassette domain-containing protein [Candidatus Eremiobacteraeota bacterium]|nr:ATP-binding cassette domain-containing protein [Candidatus Eremiobacteraeota bacterium]